MKDEVIFFIGSLLRNNISGRDKASAIRGIRNRLIGFTSELELKARLKSLNRQCLKGGVILSTINKGGLNNYPLYYSIDTHVPEIYHSLYENLSNSGVFSKLIYLHVLDKKYDVWESMEIAGSKYSIPRIRSYTFEKGCWKRNEEKFPCEHLISQFTRRQEIRPPSHNIKSEEIAKYLQKLNLYDVDELIEIYIDRLVFDGLISIQRITGIPNDIDLITLKNGKFNLIEIKEKDLSKTPPVGFGIDVRRLQDIMTLKKSTKLDYYYIVRQVSDQHRRKFVNWRWIEFGEFAEKYDKKRIKEGGGGMNSIGFEGHPTVICGVKYFKTF